MSVYKKITEIGIKFIPKSKLFKYGFNLSPMYRRSTGRVRQISDDLLHVRVKIPLSYKNRNYVNSIFGGSLFSAVDPIPMIQLINLIGDDYVVWDKSAEVYFKRPAKENVYADFSFSMEELDQIKQRVLEEKEIEIVKTTLLTDKTNSKIFCEVHKTIYVADKDFYKEKRARKNKK